MITEEEVVRAVLAQHNFAAAEKFIQEVAWRTYWKGWLEMRPAMLDRFDAERIGLKAELESNSGLSHSWSRAIEGRTGIDCFDAWVEELVTFGWLHNHARMWFASIWIFTLGLPWQLGADFFYKHLLDADPASNTLSWRWVTGLHTRGNHYIARAENIDRNTLGRFAPYGKLNEQAGPIAPDDEPPAPQMLASPKPIGSGPVALLLTEEDLHPESWGLSADVVSVALLDSQSVAPADSPARRFSEGALADAAGRAAGHFGVPVVRVDAAGVAAWAGSLKTKTVVTGHAPVGLVAREMMTITSGLSARGISLVEHQRDWDRALWPHAKAGFFKLKTKLPEVVGAL
jgi:deoxyribodipyrimidine photo-lyase